VTPVAPLPVEEHDSVTLATGIVTGSDREDSGVPGATFTVNVTFPPSTVVTVTTQVSAEATGIAAIPDTASAQPVTSATRRFRLLNTLAYPFPPDVRRNVPHWRGARLTLLAGRCLCNPEPPVSTRARTGFDDAHTGSRQIAMNQPSASWRES
jgi:hypothetical protein